VEVILPVRSFQFESPGDGYSGPVIVSGTQGANGIESLTIEAFGKRMSLNSDQLQQLQGFRANGLQLSSEGGYPQLGGHTVYLVFLAGSASEVVDRKFVTVTEAGTIRIGNKP